MVPKQKEFKFGRAGEFTFSRARGLWRSGRPIELRNLERQLLKCLLDRPNEIVRAEEIRAAVWLTEHVTDNTLNVLVRRLRETLGDAERPNAVIKSVAKMGYQIVATPELSRVAPVATETRRRDASRFIRDVTIPDGSIFEPGEPFEKVWEVQNIGSTPWLGRALRRVGTATGRGQIESEPTSPIPDTQPGGLCLIRMSLKAPVQPASYMRNGKWWTAKDGSAFPSKRPYFFESMSL